MSTNADPAGRLPSLSTLYLILAGAMAAVFLVVAATSHHLTRHAISDSSESMVLSERTRGTMDEIRNALRAVDATLGAMLLVPRPEHGETIHRQLGFIEDRLQSLIDDPAVREAGLEPRFETLTPEVAGLLRHLKDLLVRREDPAWVYPLLPYLTEGLLEPHIRFETAVDQALQEIAGRDGRHYASPLYGEFSEARDLWRSMILYFRAGMIRFAGLDDAGFADQEYNVDMLHGQVRTALAQLGERQMRDELGLQAQASLEQMAVAARIWGENWRTAMELRRSGAWRADVAYIRDHVRPAQERVFRMLADLESQVARWSAHNAARMQQAAHRTTYYLWGLTLLGLGFMALTYAVIRRSVLEPVRQIARMLARHDERRLSEDHPGRSREIRQLVRAFNDMQRQIHHRQRALEHQAMHDALTGLPNRVLLNDRLEQAVAHLGRTGGCMAVLLLDLDRFKEVNDALGHPAGDRLLQEVARRLRAGFRSTDTVARLGGDEFAILARETGEEGAAGFAAKVHAAISGVFRIQHQNVYVGTSIGVALYPQHGRDASTLLRRADIAMYLAKKQGTGTCVYRPDADVDTADRLALAGDLHAELDNPRHLSVHYQPMIRLPEGSPSGVEALLRWDHPVHGPVAPDQLIRIAEHTGLIGPLTYWVLETALREFSRVPPLCGGLNLSVNLSAWNLQDPNLPEAVSQALEVTGFPPERLTLEITESAMMGDPVHARQILELLSVMGVRLAVDDFGTGFSSLGYLKLLPVNLLKIDRSFVMDMLDNENDAVIVRSTIDLAHNLGFRVVAEGVENGEVLTLLGGLGCDYAQGYYLCRPAPAGDIEAWLDRFRTEGWEEHLVAPGLRVFSTT